jgi:hypothetical protein
MHDETESEAPVLAPLDLDRAYASYLKTCAMSGVEPVPRERALGLIQEWTLGAPVVTTPRDEVPNGRPPRKSRDVASRTDYAPLRRE